MGVKNFEKQLSLIVKSISDAKQLKDYAGSMNRIIEAIDSSWQGGTDKYMLLTAMSECVRKAMEIANNYYVFGTNSKRWLEEMDKLDKLTGAVVGVAIANNSVYSVMRNNSGKIKIDTRQLDGYANQILNYGNQLDSIYSRGIAIFGGVDSLIMKRFPSKYSERSIRNGINQLKVDNNRVARNLKQICFVYEQAESDIQTEIEAIQVSGVSWGKIGGGIVKSIPKYMKPNKDLEEKTARSVGLDDEYSKLLRKMVGNLGVAGSIVSVAWGTITGDLKDPKTWIDTAKTISGGIKETAEKVGNATVKKGAKWAGDILTVASVAIDNFKEHGTIKSERFWKETIQESKIKIGVGIVVKAGVSAAVTALLGPEVAATAVVGVVTVGVVWGIDKITKTITKHVTGQEKDFAEWLSDGYLDTKDYVKEQGKKFIQNVGKGIGNAIKGMGKVETRWKIQTA